MILFGIFAITAGIISATWIRAQVPQERSISPTPAEIRSRREISSVADRIGWIHRRERGNGSTDRGDFVLIFADIIVITAPEPLVASDHNGNGRIDAAGMVRLFNHI